MTDTYGSDPKDTEHTDHEHDLTESSTTDAWHGDQPPVDDFADHSNEEEATVIEESEPVEEGAAETTTPRRKSSMVLPITAGLGGLMFLGALLYFHNHSSTAPSPTPLHDVASGSMDSATIPAAPLSVATNKAPTPDAVAPTTALAPVADQTSAATNTPSAPAGTALPTNGNDSSTALVAPPVNPPSPPLTAPPAPAMPVAAVPAPVAPMAPPAAPETVAPAANPLTTTAPAPSAPPMAVAMPAKAIQLAPATPNSAPSALDGRLADLSARVEELQRSLASATQQLGQVSNMVAATPAPASNPALESRLNQLEQKLAQLETTPSSPHTVEATAPVTHKHSKTVAHKARHKTRHVSSKHHKTQKRSTVVHHRATTTAPLASASGVLTPPPSAAASAWVLRAASPGEAYISRSNSSPDLLPVHVGDDLPDVGRVSAIRQDGDHWVVQGSKNTIQ